MNKKMFSLIGLLSLSVAAVPFVARGEVKQAKAENTVFDFDGNVSTTNDLWGLGFVGSGIVMSTNTTFAADWQTFYDSNSNPSEKVRFIDRNGEAQYCKITTCGNSLFLNQYAATNYYGYILEIDAGFSFEVNGVTYEVGTSVSFLSKLNNGTEGTWWVTYTPGLSTTKQDIAVEVGKAETLNLSNAAGDTNPIVTWTSSNTDIATVSNTGVVTGVGEGTTTIKARVCKEELTYNVTVSAATAAQSGIRVKTKTVQTYKGYAYDWSKLQVVGLYGEAEGAAIAVTESMISGTYDINTVGDYELTVTSGDFSDTFTLQVVDVPAATVHAQYFGAGSPWGSQFYFNVNELPDVSQYIQFTGSSAEMANASAHLEYNDSPLELTYYRNCGGSRIELYYNVATPLFGDKMTIKAGFPIYKYSGNMSDTFVDAGDGEYYVAAELKQDYVYVWTGAAWEYNPDAAVQAFVDTYMHMSHVENDGSCTTEGWYTAAKAAVASLSDYARMLLASESKYADAYSRLVKWAEVNGETLVIDDFDGTLSVSSNNGMNVLNGNNVTLITIIAAMSCVALLGTALIIRKRKLIK